MLFISSIIPIYRTLEAKFDTTTHSTISENGPASLELFVTATMKFQNFYSVSIFGFSRWYARWAYTAVTLEPVSKRL